MRIETWEGWCKYQVRTGSILPMRNWTQQSRCVLTGLGLQSYLWGIETWIYIRLNCLVGSSNLTYEELKLHLLCMIIYEYSAPILPMRNWKLAGMCGLRRGELAPIFPMRNWTSTDLRIRPEPRSSNLTYENWNPERQALLRVFAVKLQSYLWGMKLQNHQLLCTPFYMLQSTYEELKR